MVRWRVALLAGVLASSVTLFFGGLSNNCTTTTLLLRALISFFLFLALGLLAGWGMDGLLAKQREKEAAAVKSVGLSVDIKSEPLPDETAAETVFQPLNAADLGDVTGNKRK